MMFRKLTLITALAATLAFPAVALAAHGGHGGGGHGGGGHGGGGWHGGGGHGGGWHGGGGGWHGGGLAKRRWLAWRRLAAAGRRGDNSGVVAGGLTGRVGGGGPALGIGFASEANRDCY